MDNLLEIKGLHAEVAGKEILRGVDLAVGAGQVHALMGPNGAGKSTLAAVLTGRPDCTVTAGGVRFKGKDLLAMPPEGRAAEGIFLSFQYPVEIPGVSFTTFLKTAVGAVRKARGQQELDAGGFLKLLKEKMSLLKMDAAFAKRDVNAGFSGGEKKRGEILQMALLSPSLSLLDETDSGLDVDALRIVSDGVNALHGKEDAVIVVTHYPKLLEYIRPDVVHVLKEGRMVAHGGLELVDEIARDGFARF